MKRLSIISIAIIMLFLLDSCSKIPGIGRRQLKLLPQSQMVSLSLTSYESFLDTVNVYKSGSNLQMVKRCGNKISKAAEKFLTDNNFSDRIETLSWEFNLVENSSVNAWCMPGGKVVFYDGIIPVCQNESGIAVVMGHEIGHAIARHGNERMSQALIAQLGGVALDVALSNKPDETRAIFNSAYGIGAQYGVILPYSRKHEYEADKLGLIFMTMAGYDPNEAIKFWERMSASGSNSMEFLSTHPVSEKRIKALKEALPEMEKYKP